MITSIRCLVLFATFAALLASANAREGSTYENERYGFRLELPGGWSVSKTEDRDATLHVVFATGEDAMTQLSVRAYPESLAGGPDQVRRLVVDSIEGDDSCTDPELETALVGDVPDALAFRVDKRTDAGTLRVHQRYVTGRGRSYVLQSVARRSSYKQLAPTFDGVWASFELLEPTAEEAGAEALRRVAERCGSQIAWAATWEEAARRARTEHKLVLVTAWFYRGFNLPDSTLSAVFTDPDVVELVNERFVPFRITHDVDVPFADHEVYGLGPFTLGAAALLVTHAGEVVDEAGLATYGFLARGVDLHPAYPGPAVELPRDPLERARLRLARGELEDAAIELGTLKDPRAHVMLAALHRRLYRAEDALLELDRALASDVDADDAFAADVALDKAQMLYRVGRTQDGLALLRAFVAERPDHARLPEALFWLGTGLLRSAGKSAAEAQWTRLVDEFPDSPFAWRAAAELTGAAYALDQHARLAWPDPRALAGLAVPDREPLANGRARQAESDAYAWLLANQQDDGSWLTPTELMRDPRKPAHDFTLAITALCARSLFGRAPNAKASAAIERALDWLVPAYAEAHASGGEVFFMDYGVWSRAFVLLTLAESVERGLREREDLEPTVRLLLEELAAKQKPGGGWSYYVRSDLASEAVSDRSISFTTAAVLLALQATVRAGFDVSEALVERGLDCLERTRARSGVFEYFDDPATARGGGPGCAGRGPACALVLHRAGRTELREVRDALGFFVAQRRGLDKECGKTLMHTGPDAQGSHYLMFDYALAAEALRTLPRRERAKYREPLLEVLLNARRAGGAFVDNASRGLAYGTAMGLTALEHLRADG